MRRAAPLLLVAFTMLWPQVACMGSRREAELEKRRAEQRLIQRLDSPGERVLIRDRHGDLISKWRLTRRGVKVYDAQMTYQGRVLTQEGDPASPIAVIERPDGKRVELAPRLEGGSSGYDISERLTLWRRGDRWTLWSTDPPERLAQVTRSAQGFEVEELRGDKPPRSMSVRDVPGGQLAAVYDSAGQEERGRAPAGLKRAQFVPFALSEHELSALERATIAALLEASERER